MNNLADQMKQTFMTLLRADSLKHTQELGVTFIEKECPVLMMNKISVLNPELLDWRKKSLQAVIDSSTDHQNLIDLIAWARYSQIPLCNLELGAHLLDTITNIQLARLLHAGDQLTWWDDFNS